MHSQICYHVDRKFNSVMNEAKCRIKRLEQELANVEAARNLFSTRSLCLTSKLTDVTRLSEEMKVEIGASRNLIDELRRENAALARQLADSDRKIGTDLHKARIDCKMAEKRARAAERETEELRQRFTAEKEATEENISQVQRIECESTQLRNELITAAHETDMHKRTRSELQGKLNETDKRLQESSSQIRAMRLESCQLEASAQLERERRIDMEKRLQEAEAQVQRVQRTNAVIGTTLQQKEQNLAKTEQESAQCKQQLADVERFAQEQLNDLFDRAEAQLSTLNERAHKAELQNKNLKGALGAVVEHFKQTPLPVETQNVSRPGPRQASDSVEQQAGSTRKQDFKSAAPGVLQAEQRSNTRASCRELFRSRSNNRKPDNVATREDGTKTPGNLERTTFDSQLTKLLEEKNSGELLARVLIQQFETAFADACERTAANARGYSRASTERTLQEPLSLGAKLGLRPSSRRKGDGTWQAKNIPVIQNTADNGLASKVNTAQVTKMKRPVPTLTAAFKSEKVINKESSQPAAIQQQYSETTGRGKARSVDADSLEGTIAAGGDDDNRSSTPQARVMGNDLNMAKETTLAAAVPTPTHRTGTAESELYFLPFDDHAQQRSQSA